MEIIPTYRRRIPENSKIVDMCFEVSPYLEFDLNSIPLYSEDSLYRLKSIVVKMPPVRHFVLKSCYLSTARKFIVDPDTGFYYAGGFTFSRQWFRQYPSGNTKVLPLNTLEKNAVSTSGVAMLGGMSDHFGHFFTDALDRIALTPSTQLMKCNSCLFSTCPAEFSAWLLSQVSTHSLGLWKTMPTLNTFHECLLYTESPSEKPIFHPHASQRIGSALSAINNSDFNAHKLSESNEILIIERGTAEGRRILNQNLILDMFPNVISCLNPAAATQLEINRRFASARVIVSTLGSQLFFNIFACGPDTTIICLVQSAYVVRGDNLLLLRSICTALSLRLKIVPCEAVGTGLYGTDLIAPLNPLKRALLDAIRK